MIVTAFAQYVSAPFYPGCDPPELLKKFLSITAILFIMTINGLSVKLSERVQIVFTVVKLCLIMSIIIAGMVQLGRGETENFENAFEGTSTSASAWAIAIYNGEWDLTVADCRSNCCSQ